MRRVLMMMTAAILALPTVGLAQLPSLGLKGGVNLADVSGPDSDYKAGLSLGAYASFSVFPMLSIQPEVLFSQKGAKEGDAKLEADYVDIPVLLKVKPSLPGVGLSPYLFAGPSAGILLSAKSGGVDIKDAYESAEFSLVLGGGLEFGRISVDARYDLGLSSATKDELAGVALDAMKNRAFTVMLGFRLF